MCTPRKTSSPCSCRKQPKSSNNLNALRHKVPVSFEQARACSKPCPRDVRAQTGRGCVNLRGESNVF